MSSADLTKRFANSPEQGGGALAPSMSERFYRPELDWLRFMAFLLVFSVHVLPKHAYEYIYIGCPEWLATFVLAPCVRAGGHGVDLFFVLSAYLITELLLRERETTGSIHIKAFYVRRILRIWPLYFIFILILFPYELFTTDNLRLYYAMTLLFAGNWYSVLWGEIATLTGHLWTISVEEQFYLVWPLLMRYSRPRSFVRILIVMFAGSTAYRTLQICFGAVSDVAIHNNTFTRIDCFALGGLLACASHWRPVVLSAGRRAALVVLSATMYWIVALAHGELLNFSTAWTYLIAASGSMLCVMAFAAAPPREYTRQPAIVFAYLGKISYGLYMFHVPVSWIVFVVLSRQNLGSGSHLAIYVLTSAALTIAVASFSYVAIERPFLRMKHHFTFVNSRPE